MEILVTSQFLIKLVVELTVEMHGGDSMMITQLPPLTGKDSKMKKNMTICLWHEFPVI